MTSKNNCQPESAKREFAEAYELLGLLSCCVAVAGKPVTIKDLLREREVRSFVARRPNKTSMSAIANANYVKGLLRSVGITQMNETYHTLGFRVVTGQEDKKRRGGKGFLPANFWAETAPNSQHASTAKQKEVEMPKAPAVDTKPAPAEVSKPKAEPHVEQFFSEAQAFTQRVWNEGYLKGALETHEEAESLSKKAEDKLAEAEAALKAAKKAREKARADTATLEVQLKALRQQLDRARAALKSEYQRGYNTGAAETEKDAKKRATQAILAKLGLGDD